VSAVLVLDGGVVFSAWQGELPKEGDVIQDEKSGDLFRVTTVVHVVGFHHTHDPYKMRVAYSTKMQRIFIEHLEARGEINTLSSMLDQVASHGV